VYWLSGKMLATTGFTQSHWMPPSVNYLRRIAPAAAMVNKFE